MSFGHVAFGQVPLRSCVFRSCVRDSFSRAGVYVDSEASEVSSKDDESFIEKLDGILERRVKIYYPCIWLLFPYNLIGSNDS